MKHDFKIGDKVTLIQYTGDPDCDTNGEVVGFQDDSVAVLNSLASATVREHHCEDAGICKKHLGKTFWLMYYRNLLKQC